MTEFTVVGHEHVKACVELRFQPTEGVTPVTSGEGFALFSVDPEAYLAAGEPEILTGAAVTDASKVFNLMALEVEMCNREKGWYEEDRTFGDEVALLHSEVSEMLEAFRDHGAVPNVSEDGAKPEGIGAEAADVLVRLLDTCSRYHVDLFAMWRQKVDYNWTRPHKHGGKNL